MARYLINKNKQDSESGENFEVHNEDICVRLPDLKNRIQLGNFTNCDSAMVVAKKKWPSQKSNIDGCYYCCEDCHEE